MHVREGFGIPFLRIGFGGRGCLQSLGLLGLNTICEIVQEWTLRLDLCLAIFVSQKHKNSSKTLTIKGLSRQPRTMILLVYVGSIVIKSVSHRK